MAPHFGPYSSQPQLGPKELLDLIDAERDSLLAGQSDSWERIAKQIDCYRSPAACAGWEEIEASKALQAATTNEILNILAEKETPTICVIEDRRPNEKDGGPPGNKRPWGYGFPLRHAGIEGYRNDADRMLWDALLLGAPADFQPDPETTHTITRVTGILVTGDGNHKVLCEVEGAKVEAATLLADVKKYVSAYNGRVSQFGKKQLLIHSAFVAPEFLGS